MCYKPRSPSPGVLQAVLTLTMWVVSHTHPYQACCKLHSPSLVRLQAVCTHHVCCNITLSITLALTPYLEKALDNTWCNTVPDGAVMHRARRVPHVSIRCKRVPRGVTWRHTVQQVQDSVNTVPPGVTRCNMMPYGAMLCCMVLHGGCQTLSDGTIR